jgi:hypothetical protein
MDVGVEGKKFGRKKERRGIYMFSIQDMLDGVSRM